MAKNETFALINVLQKINENGLKVVTRGFEQKEVLSNLEVIDNPNERVIVLKHRNNNIFALIAETLWVLGGRDDLDFLQHYLPRASEFSDDGKVWRAAYGPRLRNWYGVDQFKEVARLINQDENTKRAAMIIYDPAKDYIDTKDVPCNNWLHFMARDGKLNLNVSVRANDAIWGFGGINMFEWSVLHEMMSFWTNKETGKLSWFTGTMHVYSRHYQTSSKILESFKGKTLYDFDFHSPKFSTPLNSFDSLMENVFKLENQMRKNPKLDILDEIYKINDELIQQSMLMLLIYNLYKNNCSKNTLRDLVHQLPSSDFKIAAIEYLTRRFNDKSLFLLSDKEKEFFDYYWSEEQENKVERELGELVYAK
ncbi:thymidylate synthase [Priestia megaterium]|uniref:thymidylate synthase n=1 Tax=Priestia megaterium TaxID=1404 RepID=UPI002ABD28C6|nr:thymidylate synthase [Priestia megaterium]MED3945082.1 thymidylate synthase [Priestia megaterium]